MWTITNDLIDAGEKVGMSSCNFNEAEIAKIKHRFRLLDGDGEIYYEGLSDNCESQRAFAPLDDFARGYAGCTEIHYLVNGAWRQL
jgi:Ca2+-binding EF-hand superfamily protein